MTKQSTLAVATAIVLGVVIVIGLSFRGVQAQQGARIEMDGDDISGTVTSSKGPEAGVWVIAETKDLPTGFRKIVVTDDRGRYLVPDLPKANYRVWVRGYGLTDSPAVTATPGQALNLRAVLAPSAQAAARIQALAQKKLGVQPALAQETTYLNLNK